MGWASAFDNKLLFFTIPIKLSCLLHKCRNLLLWNCTEFKLTKFYYTKIKNYIFRWIHKREHKDIAEFYVNIFAPMERWNMKNICRSGDGERMIIEPIMHHSFQRRKTTNEWKTGWKEKNNWTHHAWTHCLHMLIFSRANSHNLLPN